MEGVQSVTFDCKIATVTLAPGKGLEKGTAEKELKKKGFGVASFKRLEKPQFSVATFIAEGEFTSDKLAAALKGLTDAGEVIVDRAGCVTISLVPGASLDEKKLRGILADTGVTAKSMERSDIPLELVPYRIELSGVEGRKRALAVRTALLSIRQVAVCQVFGDAAVIFLRERCAEIEGHVEGALKGVGVEVGTIGSREPVTAAR